MFSSTNPLARLLALATSGQLALPIGVAVLFLALSFARGPLLKLVFRLCNIQDNELKHNIKSKINGPLQLLLLSMAFLPFALLIAPPLGVFAVVFLHALTLFLLFHIFVQIVDLVLFSWYLVRRQTNVSAVVRFFVLFLLYGISALLLLDWVFGVSILPLLATSTVLTAIVGLAMQDTLKNAFAGLNMSLEKSFEQGDWILFRLGQNEQWFGQIVEIGWRTTKIKTLNNNYAVIPNSNFTNRELINFNRPTAIHARTIEIPVNLRADSSSVCQTLVGSAAAVDGVLAEPKPEALPIEIKNDSILYQLRFWMTNIERREELTGAVLERAWQGLKELGALP